MYVGKGMSNWMSARRASKQVREANQATFNQADRAAMPPRDKRERSKGCYNDGVEHSSLIYEDAARRPAGYHALACVHDKPLWEKCTSCGRNKTDAEINLRHLAAGNVMYMAARGRLRAKL